MRHFFLSTLVLFIGQSAFAYCSGPYDPDDPPDMPGSYSRPDVPYCLSSYSYSGKHTCSEWELRSYFDEVDEYQQKLRNYIRELEGYQAEVEAYVEAAAAYAVCEFDEVVAQHE